MKPRTAHLLFLGLLALPAICFGGFLTLNGLDSHTLGSGISVALGAVAVGAGLFYALVSSLLVWRLGDSARRVAAVHGGLLGGMALLVGILFLRRLLLS